jgi:endonuclease/exonuclease/phosphatase family metal-dependent hydrolase
MKKVLYTFFFVVLTAVCVGQNELSIISFNIRLGSAWANDGDNDWEHRRQAVAEMLLKERPDAVGMQEALPNQTAYLDSALRADYSRIGVGRDDGAGAGESMCIYYRRDRLELLEWRTRWLSATPDSVSFGWDAACRRTVTIARFRDKATGKEFLYLNTHLDHVGQTARRESVKLLCHWADEFGRDCPVIVGGDMNSPLTDDIFQPLAAHNLWSARDIAPSTDRRDTYNAFGKEATACIDHFFVRDCTPVSFQVLTGDYGVPYVSDHYPVSMRLSLY